MRTYILFILLFSKISTSAQIPLNKLLDCGKVCPMLYLSKDSIFYYGGVSCYESWISKGKWAVEGDSLILNSFDSINCRPIVKITRYGRRVSDSTIIIKPTIGSFNIIFARENSQPEYGILNKNGTIEIPKEKFTHFAIECKDIDNYTFTIPEYDFIVSSDYPESMVDRYFTFFTLGRKVYYIKSDGLYEDRNSNAIVFPFNN